MLVEPLLFALQGEHEADVERETHLPPSRAYRVPRSTSTSCLPNIAPVLQAKAQATNDAKRDHQQPAPNTTTTTNHYGNADKCSSESITITTKANSGY